MGNIRVVKVSDIGNIKLEQYENCSDTLFVTATRSLTYQTTKNRKISVYDITQIDNIIRADLKNSNCLSESEMRYLLHKTILNLKDNTKKTAYMNSENALYELYANLNFAQLKEINIDIDKILNNKLTSYGDVFKLYIDYSRELSKQVRMSFQEAYLECFKKLVSSYKKVSLIGFSFYKDEIQTMLRYLFSKNMLSSIYTNDDFVIDELVIPFLKEENQSYQVLKEESILLSKFDDLRNNLFTKADIDKNIANDITFIKPFFTREDEFRFIISQVVQTLRSCSTLEEINARCEKIAVVIVSQFAKQTQALNDLLKREGVFIAPNKQIFYSQDDFLKSNYKNELSKEQRLQEFSLFKRLEVYQPPRTLFNSKIGKFIAEIYKISCKGLKLANFKTLIHINWLFKETKIPDIISEFNLVKDFFENIETLEDWNIQIDNLINIKEKLDFTYELHNHPIKSVRFETLQFIKKYIVFLSNVISKIRKENGNIKRHIKTLVEAVKGEGLDENLEKELLQEFGAILNSNEDKIDIDNQYFAENFQTLIIEYLTTKTVKSNNIRLNVINMESSNKYDIVFVPMFEQNKYPMEYKYEFPYSMGIIDILSDKSLVKNYSLPKNKVQKFCLRLARHIFENLFRIAQEKIIFTRNESENGMPIDMSIFGYDIMNKLQITEKDVKEATIRVESLIVDERRFKKQPLNDMYLNEMLSYFVCPKLFYYSNLFSEKSCYSDKFLMNFYCKTLIFNRTLTKLANKQEYDETSLRKAIEKIFDIVANEIFDIIPMFDESNKNDIKLSAKNQLLNFVNEKILTGRYKPEATFILSLSKEKIIRHKSIKIMTYRNLVVTDKNSGISHEFDITRSIDCIVSSTGQRQTTKKHFWDIIAEMQSAYPIDRANSLNFLSFKLNTQLNTPRYQEDGSKRTKEVVDYLKEKEQGNLAFRHSSYCSYCKFKHICMGVIDYE